MRHAEQGHVAVSSLEQMASDTLPGHSASTIDAHPADAVLWPFCAGGKETWQKLAFAKSPPILAQKTSCLCNWRCFATVTEKHVISWANLFCPEGVKIHGLDGFIALRLPWVRWSIGRWFGPAFNRLLGCTEDSGEFEMGSIPVPIEIRHQLDDGRGVSVHQESH